MADTMINNIINIRSTQNNGFAHIGAIHIKILKEFKTKTKETELQGLITLHDNSPHLIHQ